MRVALFQPDIPQNVGAVMRIAACFGAGLDVIGPCGFPLDSREVRRVAMDYRLLAPPALHASWAGFLEAARPAGRLVLLTTKGDERLWDFRFAESDTVLMGRESAGVPPEVHENVDARLAIPLADGARSLNVAVAAAVALAEARRQVGWGRSA
ncbi:MAG: tRNA (cytidine(34)-2'-O)-methyltransferase [Alphaproteobacteria bacterium]|nr:tRNA (cytidine(34)-2'-O)-methyltransferase [Alphaproteobacteria bacterium]